MSFFVSNSLKEKIDINVINDQIEEKKSSDFSLTLAVDNINYEITEIKHDETLKINIMLTKEIVENFLNLSHENKKMKVYVFNQCLYNFYAKDAIISNFKSESYSFVKTEIIITNYENELQGDKNVKSNN